MCRHLAYLGTPVALSSLVIDPPHSLVHQSWAPLEMRGGSTINADGFGIGWLAEGDPPTSHQAPTDPGLRSGPAADGDRGQAGAGVGARAQAQARTNQTARTDGTDGTARRYRRDIPIWADPSLSDLTRSIVSGTVLAAVRSATPGMAGGEAACAPFSAGRWLFSLNGAVAGWPSSLAHLMAPLAAEDVLTLEAPTDSAALWAVVRHRLRSGEPPAMVLAAVVTDVARAAPGSRLNLLLTDGDVVVATTWGHSLWTAMWGGGVAVSSEPWDPTDPSWSAVPDHRLVQASAHGIQVTPIDEAPMDEAAIDTALIDGALVDAALTDRAPMEGALMDGVAQAPFDDLQPAAPAHHGGP